jgi:uncharacterized MAPEG superfamily protein
MDKLPYWMLLAALGTIYIPRLLVLRAQLARPEGLDNSHPRQQQAKLEGVGARAQGAQMNGFEAFAPFAAGVLACQLAHVDPTRVAWLSVLFVVIRVAYVGFYIANIATARSLSWFVGFGVVLVLLAQPLFA